MVVGADDRPPSSSGRWWARAIGAGLYVAFLFFMLFGVPHVVDAIERAGLAPWYVLQPGEADGPIGDLLKALWIVGLDYLLFGAVIYAARGLRFPWTLVAWAALWLVPAMFALAYLIRSLGILG